MGLELIKIVTLFLAELFPTPQNFQTFNYKFEFHMTEFFISQLKQEFLICEENS